MVDPIPPQDASIIPEPSAAGLREGSPPPDPLKESVDIARHAFAEATRYFDTRGHTGDERYAHLPSVVDHHHVLPLGDAEFTNTLIKQGMSSDYASATPAQYMGKRGGVLVDAVIVRKGADVRSLMMTHEFGHRAADMRGLQDKDKPYHDQMYDVLGYPKEKKDALKQNDPEEYQRVLRDTKETIRVFNEGLNQWATLFLANRTEQFTKPIDTKTYSDEVAAVRETFEGSLNARGLTHSSDQVDEIMLDIALTGDFSRLRAIIPAGASLNAVGIDDNFYIANLMQLADGAFQSKRLKRLSQNTER